MNDVVRTYRPENQLAKAVQTAGGLTIAEALAHAEENVESEREACMASLDDKIARINAAAIAAAHAPRASDVKNVYALANEILNEAGVFGLTELSEAGRSLCDLTSNWKDGVTLDSRAIQVHVAAMKSLRRPDIAGDPAIRAAVLDGLRQVTAKIKA